jgi:hypothetical protein
MLSGYLNNSIKNINHTLAVFLEEVGAEYEQAFPVTFRSLTTSDLSSEGFVENACVTSHDISKLIPNWVIAEKSNRESNGETNVVSVFDFLQKYYDWLYCDLPEGAQYSLGDNLLDIIDVQRTREEFISRIYSVYFKSFPFDDVKNSQQITLDMQKAREFIVSIKKNLHGRKTNLEAINYFFTKLFNITEEDILVYFPKVDILRLNGGMFANQNFLFTSATGGFEASNTLGSGLNISRFQDNDWFHDWSYLVFINNIQENETLKQAYIKSLHPAGLRLIFGKQISDYQGPGQSDESSVVCEFPMLKNYAEYSPTLSYGPIGTHFGIDLFGLTGCSGCDGSYHTPAATGFTGPTHVLPTWTGAIDQTRFFDINILSFIQLCFSSGLTSPNDIKTCANC